MENNRVIILIFALLVGLAGGYFWGTGQSASIGSNMHRMPDGTLMDDRGMSMGTAMEDMMVALEGLSGDAFDQAFLTEMIVHHEGAVAMANGALVSAKHSELKEMAQSIISAQTSEIEQMKNWLKIWYNK